MIILRLLLFFFLGLMLRRVYLSFKAQIKGAGGHRPPPPPAADRPQGDLSRQDISDADYEEIP